MPYALKKLPQAEAEANDAAAWYEEKKLGLGFDLLDRVDEAIANIRENPFGTVCASAMCVGRRFAVSNSTAFIISSSGKMSSSFLYSTIGRTQIG